jgi:hypothetical protein
VATDVVLVVHVYSGGNAVTITPPAGWTLSNRTDNGAVSGVAVYWGLGSATFGAWSFGATLGGAAIAYSLGYTSVNNTTPMDATAVGQANASNALATAPSINTVTANATLVGLFGWYDVLGGAAPTWSLEFGTFRQSGSLVGASLPDTVSGDSADAVQAATGASGTKTATASIAMPNIGILVALRPAGGTVGTASLIVTATGTPTFVRKPIKVLAVTATGTPSFLKNILRTLAVTATGTAVITAKKVALVTLAVTATATALIVKMPIKVLAVTATVTPVMVKNVLRTLAATATGTASVALTKVKVVILAVTSTATVAMVKMPLKVFSVAATATPLLTKQVARVLAVTSTITTTLSAVVPAVAAVTRRAWMIVFGESYRIN